MEDSKDPDPPDHLSRGGLLPFSYQPESQAFVAETFRSNTQMHLAILIIQSLSIPMVMMLLDGEETMVAVRIAVCCIPQLLSRIYLTVTNQDHFRAATHFFWLVYLTTVSHWLVVIYTERVRDWAAVDGSPFLLVLYFLFSLMQGYLLCTVACLRVDRAVLSAVTCLLLCALHLTLREESDRQIVSHGQFFIMLTFEVVLCNCWVLAQLHERRVQFDLNDEVMRQRDRLQYELSFAYKAAERRCPDEASELSRSHEEIPRANLLRKQPSRSSARSGGSSSHGGSSYGTDSELMDAMARRSKSPSRRGGSSTNGSRTPNAEFFDSDRDSPPVHLTVGMRKRQEALWQTLQSMGITVKE